MRSLAGVLRQVGSLLLLFSLLFLLPIATAAWYREPAAIQAFAGGALLSAGIGLLLYLSAAGWRGELKARDGYLLVTLAWLSMAAVAAAPIVWLLPGIDYTHAWFEAVSGLTTTGASAIGNVDLLPHAVNLWRHALSWLGGMGIIVMGVAILPLLGIGGMQMYRADAPGGTKDTKLGTRIVQTSRLLWAVYGGMTLLCLLALRAAGMHWFDAICYAFSTLSLGAFAPHAASVGYFDSPAIELILALFMLLAAMNFTTHFLALRRGEPGTYGRDPEARWMIIAIFSSIVLVSVHVWLKGTYPTWGETFRRVAFNLISTATTCGLFSADYENWPVFAPMWMMFLGCVCACTGSTGGGTKMFRTLVLAKQSLREMFTLVHPAAVAPLKVAGQIVPNQVAYSVLAFIFLYFMVIVSLTFGMLLSGVDFITAFSAIVACVNNMGPGLGRVGPGEGYGSLNHFQLWLCTAAMLIGRVEIFTILVLFTRTYWRK